MILYKCYTFTNSKKMTEKRERKKKMTEREKERKILQKERKKEKGRKKDRHRKRFSMDENVFMSSSRLFLSMWKDGQQIWDRKKSQVSLI